VTGSWGYLNHGVLNNSKNNAVGRIILFFYNYVGSVGSVKIHFVSGNLQEWKQSYQIVNKDEEKSAMKLA